MVGLYTPIAIVTPARTSLSGGAYCCLTWHTIEVRQGLCALVLCGAAVSELSAEYLLGVLNRQTGFYYLMDHKGGSQKERSPQPSSSRELKRAREGGGGQDNNAARGRARRLDSSSGRSSGALSGRSRGRGRGRAVQVDTGLTPCWKALGFNSLTVQCFQANGFKYQPAPPLHRGSHLLLPSRE